ncbi:MAG: NAD-binding protein [Myxococcota bacterium]|nr:NAD-binding protein [Myxococcota bacterium]
MFKTFSSQTAALSRRSRAKRNASTLVRFAAIGGGMVVLYTVIFHLLMDYEGQEHTWLTGFYWTLTVMSTLGFGDITFHTDLGRGFSILVLLSGMIYLLVLLPFTFIQFFYEPWIRAQDEARAPRKLPEDTADHILLTQNDPIASAIIQRLDSTPHDHVIVVEELEEALHFRDLGRNVLLGDHDDPKTWKRAQVEKASLVVASGSDVMNTTVAFTIGEVTQKTPIISTSSKEASVDVLELAGSTHVLHLDEMMGRSFARRAIGGDALAHVSGEFGDVRVAEATTRRTPLVGQTIAEADLREKVGITVAGVWERGRFEAAQPDTPIGENTVLILAGSEEALFRYDELFCIYNVSASPTVILGGGNVGSATARALDSLEIDYRIVEQRAGKVADSSRVIIGDAADLPVLKAAGIDEAPTVVVTTHDDDLNVYLALYCRRLRPDIQILSRCTYERNVAKLHRAGADIVMSYASMGADMVMNLLHHGSILVVAAGLDVFRRPVPEILQDKTILESGIREKTGCSIIALESDGTMRVGPEPSDALQPDTDMLLIGSVESEQAFLDLYEDS